MYNNDFNFDREGNQFSRRMQGKRAIADENSCKFDLKEELPQIFQVFKNCIYKTNEVLFLFPPQSRSRNLEASIVQSCFAENLVSQFQNKAFFGKHKRLILNVNGYLILFKKLDKKGLPMNIKTTNVQSILNQNQSLDLFANTEYNDDPILYFGYQKNRFGEYINPQLVYIDEGKIKFSLTEADITVTNNEHGDVVMNNKTEALPKLKDNLKQKKAN